MSAAHDRFELAQRHIPGGINSPVRAFKGVGGDPVFVDSATGPYLFDPEGKRYIDYVGSWGPMILGHAHPEVIEAVAAVIHKGLSFGAPTEIETQMADRVCTLMPSIELVRMVSSGTEATMSAVRLARGYTGRKMIIKFDGCYHGHADSLLVAAGSGVATLDIPGSPGVPSALAARTLSLPFNEPETMREVMQAKGDQIAAIIVEPVVGNMGLVPPADGFLEMLREVTQKHGALLIFDEVMTGFRVARGGAQALFGIAPDITCFGKIIGGGFPIGAVGGKATACSWAWTNASFGNPKPYFDLRSRSMALWDKLGAELPDLPYRRTGIFTERTVPDGLLNDHATKTGVWGVITVIAGRLRFIVPSTGEDVVLPPDIEIGYDAEADRARFDVTANGAVLVTRDRVAALAGA